MTTMPQVTTPASTFTAVYDAWNRMVEVSDGGSTIGQYTYDGRNRRIVKVTPSETRHFYYTDSWQDIEQHVGTSGTPDQQHVWGVRYIDELICRDDATPLRLYATQDANFNVTAVVNSLAGAVAERFMYDPYGCSSILTASWMNTIDAYNWIRRFQSGDYDLLTAFYLFRRRIFHPLLGNWMQRDDEYRDGANLFQAFLGDPVACIDPFGLKVFTYPDPDRNPSTDSVADIDITETATDLCDPTKAGTLTISVSITVNGNPLRKPAAPWNNFTEIANQIVQIKVDGQVVPFPPGVKPYSKTGTATFTKQLSADPCKQQKGTGYIEIFDLTRKDKQAIPPTLQPLPPGVLGPPNPIPRTTVNGRAQVYQYDWSYECDCKTQVLKQAFKSDVTKIQENTVVPNLPPIIP